MERGPVVVVGAGPAGLGAAHELARQGVGPLVLEKASQVGGLARTVLHKGYRFDIGGHRFYTRHAELRRLWCDMLGEDLLTVRRLSRIHYQGRFFKYPLEFRNTLSNLGVAESSLILLSYLRAKLRFRPEEQSFEQWVTNRFGSRLYRMFFRSYTEKVWGLPCHVIRADWAAQRIGGLSVMTALRHALFGSNGSRTLISEFLYPVLGPGMMWQRFGEVVEALGGQVRLASEAASLRHEGGRIRRLTVRTLPGGPGAEGELCEIEPEQVITSMPLGELVSRLTPEAPQEVRRAAASLSYRAFILVAVVVGRAEVFPDNWIYVHSPDAWVGRIQNFGNWSPALVPLSGRSCLGLEYFCTEGDGMWRMGDRELLDLAGIELESLGLCRRKDLEDGAVVRQTKAYPIYDREYAANVAVIREYLAGFENLQTIGRNGMHRYNNQDHSMLAGIQAARNILGERHDLWSVNPDAVGEEKAEPVPVSP